MDKIIVSLSLFFAAALLEIGGGYMVWRWLREKKGFMVGLVGSFVLFAYGVIPTLQPAHFGRVYVAYGGVFITTSILWGMMLDKKMPDRHELIGGVICLLGALIIFFGPR